MADNNKSEVVSIRVSKRVLKRAQMVAGRDGVKVGDIAREALLREVERREKVSRGA